MTSLFTVSYGSKSREDYIIRFLESDPTIAVILASVHFEWMLKRTIMKLGHSPTKALKEKLDSAYKFDTKGQCEDLKMIWIDEISNRISSTKRQKSSFEKVIGNSSPTLGGVKIGVKTARDIRSKIIHGNGSVSKKDATKAVHDFIYSSNNLRQFVIKCGEDLDSRLIPRMKKR